MDKLLLKLQQLLPSSIIFIAAKVFYWSPKNQTIYYNDQQADLAGKWALIHEAAHALLGHKDYQTDIGLLILEAEAWQKAQEISKNLGVKIDEQHIEDCLNTYRDWLYARSTCPTCMLNSLQIDANAYMCLNCSTRWTVSKSRFCRPYRKLVNRKQELETSIQKNPNNTAFL